MTTEQHLSSYGVTIQDARDFIMNNYVVNLQEVYNTCQTFGVSNDMVAEILSTDIPGVSGAIVSNFFDNAGLDGSSLDTITADEIEDFFVENSDDFDAIYTTFKNSDFSNDTIAEYLQSSFPGLTGEIVSNFFNDNGFDGSALGFDAPSVSIPDMTLDVVKDGLYFGTYNGDFSGSVAFNVEDDSLSGAWVNPYWGEYDYINSGVVDQTTGEMTAYGAPQFTGTINGAAGFGSWTDADGNNGSFSVSLIGTNDTDAASYLAAAFA